MSGAPTAVHLTAGVHETYRLARPERSAVERPVDAGDPVSVLRTLAGMGIGAKGARLLAPRLRAR